MNTNQVNIYNLEVLTSPYLNEFPPYKVNTYGLEVLTYTDKGVKERPVHISEYQVEIIHKFVPVNSTEENNDAWEFSGTVKEYTTAVVREVSAFDRETFIHLNSTMSEVDGSFVLTTTSSGISFLVCSDDIAGDSYNYLMAATVLPKERL